MTANNQLGIGRQTPKQKCSAIGGLFIAIGIILSLVGNSMERHNRFLIEDLRLSEREREHVRWQVQQGIYTATERVRVLQEVNSEVMQAEMRIRNSAHSHGLILLLRGLGGFLLLFGFVLTVVGWILPQNKPYCRKPTNVPMVDTEEDLESKDCFC